MIFVLTECFKSVVAYQLSLTIHNSHAGKPFTEQDVRKHMGQLLVNDLILMMTPLGFKEMTNCSHRGSMSRAFFALGQYLYTVLIDPISRTKTETLSLTFTETTNLLSELFYK